MKIAKRKSPATPTSKTAELTVEPKVEPALKDGDPLPGGLIYKAPSRRPFDAEQHCGAQLRKKQRGRLCTHFKGERTPHPGVGRCWLHGGLTPIKHGLASLIKHDRLKDLIAQMEAADVDLMDLTPEVKIMRAMVIDYVNRHDDFIDMLTSWYDALDTQRAAEDLPPLPRTFPTIEDAAKLLEAISRIVERMHKISREGSITLDVFRSLMGQMGMVVSQYVIDDKVLQKIEAGWSQIMVNPRSFLRADATKPVLLDGGDDA